MGFENRLRRLEQDLGDEAGPPQAYIDARNRRKRHLRALMTLGLGEELDPGELAFKEGYQDSEQWAQDTQIIERYASPDQGSSEAAAQRRAKMKETLDAIVERRRTLGI